MKAQRIARYWLRLSKRFLKIDDTPHCIAIGVALGVFVGLTPTVGLQTGLLAGMGFLLRGILKFNKLAAVGGICISNPLTFVPIYWIDYKVGTFLFGETLNWGQLAGLLETGTLSEIGNLFFGQLGLPLLCGALIVATLGAGLSYFLTRWLVERSGSLLTTVRRRQSVQRRLRAPHDHPA